MTPGRPAASSPASRVRAARPSSAREVVAPRVQQDRRLGLVERFAVAARASARRDSRLADTVVFTLADARSAHILHLTAARCGLCAHGDGNNR